MLYNIKVGSLATAIPVIHYLLRGKWWTDKRRSLWESAAFFLFRSIIFSLYSRNRIVVWTISMNSEREIELKSFMNSFIKRPSFPKLRKSSLKTMNQTMIHPDGQPLLTRNPTFLILRKIGKSPAENCKK